MSLSASFLMTLLPKFNQELRTDLKPGAVLKIVQSAILSLKIYWALERWPTGKLHAEFSLKLKIKPKSYQLITSRLILSGLSEIAETKTRSLLMASA
jgi:hypothetical protein